MITPVSVKCALELMERDAEIEQLDAKIELVGGAMFEPDVGRFDVAVNESALVGHGQAFGGFARLAKLPAA